MNDKPQPIHLADYRVPDYLIPTLHLDFDLREEWAVVTATLRLRPNPAGVAGAPLRLDGRELELLAVALDGRPLPATEYQLDPESLTLPPLAAASELVLTTRIRPQENEALEGLYRSSGNFCTQCEAQGFRKITYFLDRPDVMSRYTTTIHADRRRYPVLLANGNLVSQGAEQEGRHRATWEDPFPKPAYLFALVAGDLACIEDHFQTRSGRKVALQIYVQPHNADKCGHAMLSLQKAMRWDEEVFGLEYDLDQFMIVAVDDFNMGAMENKGLNIFNSKYILAQPETATDEDYFGIERVVAHEYFHNWTGNRVTCRDWFQLSLKEGLTVFRDQQFSAAMASPPVQRIHDVMTLRNHQFPEDASPMAHPIRPASYIEINNFYTVTVYEKGAEVIRMLHTMLGAATFRRGMDLYFARHDGQAVTTDDFLQAMEDAWAAQAEGPAQGLTQFRLWYSQAGTPELATSASYDPDTQSYHLTVEQLPATLPGQEPRLLHLPLTLGLLGADGRELELRLAGEEKGPAPTSRLLAITRPRETFHFVNIPQPPVPSLLRDFSAPVKLRHDYAPAELRFLLRHDPDAFNRWEAGQRLFIDALQGLMADYRQGRELRLAAELVALVETILAPDFHPDRAFVTQLLTLPSEEYLAELMVEADVEAIHAARQFMRRELARQLRPLFAATYTRNRNAEPYRYDAGLAGQRQLKNLCLQYLIQLNDDQARSLALDQWRTADNMSDEYAALRAVAHTDCPERLGALAAFYEKWQADPLVVDKWLILQATAPLATTLAEVEALLRHPGFNFKVPNKVRSLIGAFAGANPICFHERSGAGYLFLAEMVLRIDAFNAQIAARLLGRLSRWRKYDPARQLLMKAALERIIAQPGLSKGCYEIANKSLE